MLNKIPLLYLFLWVLTVLFFSCDPDNIPPPTKPPSKNCTLVTRTPAIIGYPQISSAGQKIMPAQEPDFAKQWYLHNSKNTELDINIMPVYQCGYGTKPTAVGILDSGIDAKHRDLTGSVLVENFYGYDAIQEHGTNVAGLIAARDNRLGIIGVAPRAKLYSYAVFSADNKNGKVNRALQHANSQEIAVYNLSFGYNNFYTYRPLESETREAMDNVTQNGFGGKGSSLVVAAGNLINIATNDGYLHHYAVIAVNAISRDGDVPEGHAGSTVGVNLWLTAPAGLLTTANGNKYNENFGRTSSAAPLVSGAIALLRSEFPNLTWRDVKLILAESAQKYDRADSAKYAKTGYFYSNPAKEQTYSEKMGFGLLDVSSAFALAKNWRPLPPMKEDVCKVGANLSIDEKKTQGFEVTQEFEVKDTIEFIESVTVEMKNIGPPDSKEFFSNYFFVSLESPDSNIKGEVHILRFDPRFDEKAITLLFSNFLGSPAAGKWKVKLKTKVKQVGQLSVTFRGH